MLALGLQRVEQALVQRGLAERRAHGGDAAAFAFAGGDGPGVLAVGLRAFGHGNEEIRPLPLRLGQFAELMQHAPGSAVICLLGLENQMAIDPDMPLHLFGYEGGDYRLQLTRKGQNATRC